MAWIKYLMCFAALLCSATAIAGQPDYTQELNSYVGKSLILRSYGDLLKVTVKRKNIGQPAGTCDKAVEILKATQKKDKVIFRLEQIGNIMVGGPSRCYNVWTETEFAISDLGDISSQDFAAMLQDVFLTPEAYLARNGRPFNFMPSEETGPVVTAGKDVSLPRPVLQIDPTLTDEARRSRIEKSLVRVNIVFGTDGRIHSPRVMASPGYGLDQQALRVLPLWRFEPARQGDKLVACQSEIQFTFAVY